MSEIPSTDELRMASANATDILYSFIKEMDDHAPMLREHFLTMSKLDKIEDSMALLRVQASELQATAIEETNKLYVLSTLSGVLRGAEREIKQIERECKTLILNEPNPEAEEYRLLALLEKRRAYFSQAIPEFLRTPPEESRKAMQHLRTRLPVVTQENRPQAEGQHLYVWNTAKAFQDYALAVDEVSDGLKEAYGSKLLTKVKEAEKYIVLRVKQLAGFLDLPATPENKRDYGVRLEGAENLRKLCAQKITDLEIDFESEDLPADMLDRLTKMKKCEARFAAAVAEAGEGQGQQKDTRTR